MGKKSSVDLRVLKGTSVICINGLVYRRHDVWASWPDQVMHIGSERCCILSKLEWHCV